MNSYGKWRDYAPPPPGAYRAGWCAVLTVVQLAIAAVWVGALVHVVRTDDSEPDRHGHGRPGPGDRGAARPSDHSTFAYPDPQYYER